MREKQDLPIGALEISGTSFGGRLRAFLGTIWASRTATVGVLLVLFWILVVLFSLVTTLDPYEQDVTSVNAGPSPAQGHWLGTDDLGRDLLARVVHGSRLVLVLAPLSVLCAVAVGSTLGLVAGYYGGVVDDLVMRLLDALMAFPTILLYMIIIAALGASPANVVMAITIGGTPGIARLIRSLTIDIKSRDYVAAAESAGESPLFVMFGEILINARGPIIVDAMLGVGYAIFAIGALGFLGLGMPPPSPDWGSMIARARLHIWSNPWAVVWPSIAIASLVVGLNLFADGLNEESFRYQ